MRVLLVEGDLPAHLTPSRADHTGAPLRDILWRADRAMEEGRRQWAEGFIALAFDLLDAREAT